MKLSRLSCNLRSYNLFKFNAYSEESTVTQNSNELCEKLIFHIENMKQVLQKVLPPSIG